MSCEIPIWWCIPQVGHAWERVGVRVNSDSALSYNCCHANV